MSRGRRDTAADLDALVEGVRRGRRRELGRAITLVESLRPEDRLAADRLVSALAVAGGSSHRVGVTGVPGAGKSTVIDALGIRLTARGHKVAVLAVDPSSTRSGGSILGDKTRMARLARDPNAFIRPTPTSGTLGGVARRTREAIVVCEAAGFDIVVVETVGVGQSEVAVSQMVDSFVVIALSGGGDELQGIKRGILELADVFFVNKADGDNLGPARAAQRELLRALELVPPRHRQWTPPVLTGSAHTTEGLDELWQAVEDHRQVLLADDTLARDRASQRVGWLWQALESGLLARLRNDPEVGVQLAELETKVRVGEVSPDWAASEVLERFFSRQSRQTEPER